jgi:hypothetical protein
MKKWYNESIYKSDPENSQRPKKRWKSIIGASFDVSDKETDQLFPGFPLRKR